MCSLVSFSIVRYVASHLRPMIDLFGPHHVSTVDDERISEIEHAFEVPWFLHVYRLLTCPKLGGEQHLEAEEFGEVVEAFGLDGPGSCGPCVFPLPLEGHQCKVGN